MLHVWNIYYIWVIFGVNVGKYSIHGASGVYKIVFLDLREGFPWPARPFKHTESNFFNYTFKQKKVGIGVSYYLRCLVVWPALHIFKCRYSKNHDQS